MEAKVMYTCQCGKRTEVSFADMEEVGCPFCSVCGVEMKKDVEFLPEFHQRGYISFEQNINMGGCITDIGIQIGPDGRIWICVNGIALIRFNPNFFSTKEKEES